MYLIDSVIDQEPPFEMRYSIDTPDPTPPPSPPQAVSVQTSLTEQVLEARVRAVYSLAVRMHQCWVCIEPFQQLYILLVFCESKQIHWLSMIWIQLNFNSHLNWIYKEHRFPFKIQTDFTAFWGVAFSLEHNFRHRLHFYFLFQFWWLLINISWVTEQMSHS